MLDTKDTDTVRQWLDAALLSGEASGKNAAALARYCDVTPQAVNGWKKTGRIRKSHLAKAAEFFGSSPVFAEASPVPAPLAWPFARVSMERFGRLPLPEREKIESHALFVISEWEERVGRAAAAQPKRATG